MKYCENKFHQTSWLKSCQKIKTHSKEPIECKCYESADDVPDPKEISPEHKNLMIFDDLLLQKQNKCEGYYVRGRHSNCDCLYLSQNYFKLPCQTIRENANFFCLFPQDQKNIDHIFNDHVSQDMTKDQFKNFAKRRGRSLITLLWLIWPHQRTAGNTDLDLKTFILFNKWLTLNFLKKLFKILLRKLQLRL